MKIFRSSPASCCLYFAVTFYSSRGMVFVCGEQNSCSQFLQLTHWSRSPSWGVCTQYSQQSQYFVSESLSVSWFLISVYIDFFFCILRPCRSDVLGLFTLSISLLSDFISSLLLSFFLDIICFFSDKKESRYFFNWIFSRYFRYRTYLRRNSGGSNFPRGMIRRKYSTHST